jgi:hypothetical protein
MSKAKTVTVKTITRKLKLMTVGTYSLTYHEMMDDDGPVLIGSVSCQTESLKKVFGKIPGIIELTFKQVKPT